jgi:tRNA pseudouridine55 synthase
MRRIGHCGTLDPSSTGVLLVCLGRFTRLNEWLSAGEKEYRAVLTLGSVSDTYDSQGSISSLGEVEIPEVDTLRDRLQEFKGAIEQIPPAFSALKVNGVRSYKLARSNRAVPLKPRQVHVAAIEIIEYKFPQLVLRVVCSKGTYIRSLAADLGTRLGCGAYVQELRRLRVGNLDLSRALNLDGIRDAELEGRLQQCFIPPHEALSGLPSVHLEPGRLMSFVHGHSVHLGRADAHKGQICAVYDLEQGFYGMGRREGEEELRPVKVLRN